MSLPRAAVECRLAAAGAIAPGILPFTHALPACITLLV